MNPELTVSLLCEEANQFARIESSREHASLFGVTGGSFSIFISRLIERAGQIEGILKIL